MTFTFSNLVALNCCNILTPPCGQFVFLKLSYDGIMFMGKSSDVSIFYFLPLFTFTNYFVYAEMRGLLFSSMILCLDLSTIYSSFLRRCWSQVHKLPINFLITGSFIVSSPLAFPFSMHKSTISSKYSLP